MKRGLHQEKDRKEAYTQRLTESLLQSIASATVITYASLLSIPHFSFPKDFNMFNLLTFVDYNNVFN